MIDWQYVGPITRESRTTNADWPSEYVFQDEQKRAFAQAVYA
ncbi:MAG TPA: hypothetical protein VF552_01625 [Allosphingosinicella sp.]|jgi:hypothetical protein